VSSAESYEDQSTCEEWTPSLCSHVLWYQLTSNITRRIQADCDHYANKSPSQIVAQVAHYTISVEQYLAMAGRCDIAITRNTVRAYFELLTMSKSGGISYTIDCEKVYLH